MVSYRSDRRLLADSAHPSSAAFDPNGGWTGRLK